MENLQIKFENFGRRTKYTTEFNSPGSIKKIVDYLKTKNNPKIDGISPIEVISVKSKESSIKRVMTCPLPDTDHVKSAIGDISIHVKYDIAYDEDTIVITAQNPISIAMFFKFKEQLVISNDNGILTFEREAEIFNAGKQIPLIGHTYQFYDDYFNRHTLAFYLGLSNISNI